MMSEPEMGMQREDPHLPSEEYIEDLAASESSAAVEAASPEESIDSADESSSETENVDLVSPPEESVGMDPEPEGFEDELIEELSEAGDLGEVQEELQQVETSDGASAEIDDLESDEQPEPDRLEVEDAPEVGSAEAGESVEEPEAEVSDQGEAAESSVPDDDRDWFVVHCYSGYENKVRHNLEQRIETMGMKNKIFDVVVPTEEEIEVKDGKRKTVERRVFPGYILVQMLMDEDSWYVVRNTPGVTGFVGMGNDPTPLRPEEVSQIVKRMEAEAPRIKVTYSIGQKVRIIDGPFNDFIGTVADIDMERAKVRVMVSFFGRETPVELDFLQVEKA
jgi:transcriptional antiterminator NusG